jgi:hypothetical protein
MPIFNKAHFFERSRVKGIISVGRELFAGKGGRSMKKKYLSIHVCSMDSEINNSWNRTGVPVQ